MLACTALAVALTFTGGSAHAQETPPARAEAGSDNGEIIVTARRREERLQNVPQAILAFSGETLARANVTSIADVARLAPGLVNQPAALGDKALTLTLRAQRQNLPNLTYDPSVVIYFAEVPTMRMLGGNAALYDLASLQVLKGPQGTLFGRNATGGALLITPQAPGEEFGGYVKAGIGNYSSRELEAAVNLPIATGLSLRISGRHQEHDGYERVIGKGYSVNDQNDEGLRAYLRYRSDGGFSNDLIVDYVRQGGSGTAYVIGSCNPTGRSNTRPFTMCADLARQRAAPFHSTTSDVDPKGTRIWSAAVSNITNAELGDITLKNIIGYRKTNSYFSFDIDGSSQNILQGSDKMRVRQITDEVQLIGQAFDRALVYQVGAFFFDEKGTELQQTFQFGSNGYTDFDATNKSYSVYGQATYNLPWIEGVSVTAGLRQTWDQRQMVNRSRTITATQDVCRILTANVNGVSINPCQKTVDASFDSLTYNLSIDWKITGDLLAYIATRKGYRTGGFLNSARNPSEFEPYRPETITDYELGVKADYRFGGVIGRTNLALYSGTYKDIQRTITVNGLIDPQTGATFARNSILNAGRARISGVEIEQMIRPFPLLELNVSYAYTKAKYLDFLLPDGRDFTKAPFAAAPKHTLAGSVRLDAPVDEAVGRISAQLSGSYRSSTIMADLTSFNLATQTVFPTSVLKGFGTLDGRIEWEEVLGSSVDLSVFVRNLTDKEYFNAGQDVSALGFASFIEGAPRTYGVQVRAEF